METSYILAFVAFALGIGCMLWGVFGMRTPSYWDIGFVAVGFFLSCWLAHWFVPKEPLPETWMKYGAHHVLKAITWAREYIIVLGITAFAVTLYGAHIAYGTSGTLATTETTYAAPGATVPTQTEATWVLGVIALLIAGSVVWALLAGTTKPTTPLTKLARTAREHDARFGAKFFPKEDPFSIRIPAEFLDEQILAAYKADAVQAYIDQQGQGTLTVSSIYAVYPSSEDGHTVNSTVIEFKGEVKTGRRIKKMMPTGKTIKDKDGKDVPELAEKEVDEVKEIDRGSVTVLYDISAAETAKRANALEGALRHNLSHGKTSSSVGADTTETPDTPKLKNMPQWKPVIVIDK